MRKLAKTRAVADAVDSTAVGADARKSTTKRDIIAEYADYGSKVYAPIVRKGQHPDKLAKRGVDAIASDLTTLGGLQQVEATLPRSATQAQTMRPQPKAARSTQARMDRTITQHLERTDKMLRTVSFAYPRRRGPKRPLTVRDDGWHPHLVLCTPTGRDSKARRAARGAAGVAPQAGAGGAPTHAHGGGG